MAEAERMIAEHARARHQPEVELPAHRPVEVSDRVGSGERLEQHRPARNGKQSRSTIVLSIMPVTTAQELTTHIEQPAMIEISL